MAFDGSTKKKMESGMTDDVCHLSAEENLLKILSNQNQLTFQFLVQAIVKARLDMR